MISNNRYFNMILAEFSSYYNNASLCPSFREGQSASSVTSIGAYFYSYAIVTIQNVKRNSREEAQGMFNDLLESVYDKLHKSVRHLVLKEYDGVLSQYLRQFKEGLDLNETTNYQGFMLVTDACATMVAASMLWLEMK